MKSDRIPVFLLNDQSFPHGPGAVRILIDPNSEAAPGTRTPCSVRIDQGGIVELVDEDDVSYRALTGIRDYDRVGSSGIARSQTLDDAQFGMPANGGIPKTRASSLNYENVAGGVLNDLGFCWAFSTDHDPLVDDQRLADPICALRNMNDLPRWTRINRRLKGLRIISGSIAPGQQRTPGNFNLHVAEDL